MSQTQDNNQNDSVCPSCHKELPQDEDILYCPYCGHKMITPSKPEKLLDEQHPKVESSSTDDELEQQKDKTEEEPLSAASDKSDAGETTTIENPAPPTPEKKSWKKWFILFVVIASVIAAIILIVVIIFPRPNPTAADSADNLVDISGFPNYGNQREKTNLYDQQAEQREDFSGMTLVFPREWGTPYLEVDFDLLYKFDHLYRYTENDNLKFLALKTYDRSIADLENLEKSMHELLLMMAKDIMPTQPISLQFKDFEADGHMACYACYSGILDSLVSKDTSQPSDHFDIYHTMILGDDAIYSIMLMERSEDKETYIDDYLKTVVSVHLGLSHIASESSFEEPSGLTDAQHKIFDSVKFYHFALMMSREEMISRLEDDGYDSKDAKFVVDSCKIDWKQNALKMAQACRDYSSYSHEGLIDYLEYEKFTLDEVRFAMDNCKIDWNEQAVKSMNKHLSYGYQSKQELMDMLAYEKFTDSEIQHAMKKCTANWKEQALKAASYYLEYSPYSYQGLLDQLEYEKFTTSEATYAVENCGADWMAQAEKYAKKTMEIYPKSREELLESLKSAGFTTEQAEYGVTKAGL